MNSAILLISSSSIIKYHGFLLWRHKSNEATCIEYKSAQGDQKIIAVKDAKFRSVLKFGTYGKDSSLSNFSTKNKNGTWNIDGTSVNIPHNPGNVLQSHITNDLIYEQWASVFISDKSAKENCDVWITYQGTTDSQSIVGVPAVEWCRNQNINGFLCDLPNEYQTICIYACGDKIDILDPTAKDYPNLKLGYTAKGDPSYSRSQRYNNSVSYALWSSTEYSANYARSIYYNGLCANNAKNVTRTAIPILEF